MIIKKIKREGFKPTDNLSPSETAAVVSQWTRDNWSDSFKDDLPKAESFRGFIKDSECPMDVYVDKETGIVYVDYLVLDNSDLEEYKTWVRDSDISHLNPDDVYVEVMNQLSEDFVDGNVLATKSIQPSFNRTQLERELDDCKHKSLLSYNKLLNLIPIND
jgi:hypothetical protein